MKLNYKNVYKPAPRWFRLTRIIVSWIVNLAMLLMISLDYGDTKIMIIVKVIQSAIADLFQSLLAEVETTPVEIIESPDEQKQE
ncbi:MAG: hypothetical protein EKK63_02305 [Acinetobacter sp.]|uniref:hypothetical protein n=1 Tax=Acinetobacter sp. TaxID=472 RepID=UPI000FA88D71|nr:hypothetical protein [Acinetobacter sp.]RUP42149.1 MAG: hypothetical protein EKK63_02305 [Acinetobacter sp.]